MRRGDFSELLNPNNLFYTGARTIIDPRTGQPFPGNVIPPDRLSPNGRAFLNTFPPATPGFRQGRANLIQSSENPQDQRKDTIRLDYRLNDSHQLTYRYSGYSWVAIDAFSDWVPLRADGLGSAERHADSQLDRHAEQQPPERAQLLALARRSVHQRVHRVGPLPGAAHSGINYPYIFANQGKEIEDKIPSINIAQFSSIDGGPYPASSQGPIHTLSNVSTLVKGRHTFKAGVVLEYSGEDDFDQINVASIPGGTNNQNGLFEFQDARRRWDRRRDRQRGPRPVQQLRRARPARLYQVAVARDRHLLPGLVEADGQPDAGRRHPVGLLATVVLDDEQHRQLRPAVLRSGDGRRSSTRVPGGSIGGDRYNGIVLPGDGFEGEGNDLVVAGDPRVQALFRGEPRGFSDMHYNVIEPRIGAAYSRQRQDDDTRERGRLPQPRDAQRLYAARRQSTVPADGHRGERQCGQSGRWRQRRDGFAVRHPGSGRRRSSTRRPTCGRSASAARSRSGSCST